MNVFQFTDLQNTDKYKANVATANKVSGVRKFQPNSEVSRRVWQFHRGMLHTSLRRLALMIKLHLITNAPCTVEEINLISYHQECPACALASKSKQKED